MSFGTRLKESREANGYKQNQFAELLGITATRLNYWEKDKREPDVAMIKKISSILNVSSDWLIGNDEYTENDTLSFSTVEQNLIKKYRSLDYYGKETVNSVIDLQYERCTNKVKVIPIELPMSLYGASAGTGNWLDEEYNIRVKVKDTPEARRANIVIRVSGDSMEPKYSDDDKVLVKIQPDIDIGEIGVFIVDNQGYIKKKGTNELISLNPEYENIPIGECTNCICVGRVLGKAEIVDD